MEDKEKIIVDYSLANALSGRLQGYKIDIGEVVVEGGTTYFQFFITDGNILYQMKKRFDEFRILREEMTTELESTSPSNRPFPSYHVVPTLPDTGIDKVCQTDPDQQV